MQMMPADGPQIEHKHLYFNVFIQKMEIIFLLIELFGGQFNGVSTLSSTMHNERHFYLDFLSYPRPWKRRANACG